MLVGLAQFQREELLAALLTFRALYFVLPALLGYAPRSVCGNFACLRAPCSAAPITVRNAALKPC